MRLTWRDASATLFVAAAVLLYALSVTGTAAGGWSTRTVGAVVFALGWLACMSADVETVYARGEGARAARAYAVAVSLLGAVALVAGVVTLVAASGAALAALVVAMAMLWALSTVRHAVRRPAPPTAAGTGPDGDRTTEAAGSR